MAQSNRTFRIFISSTFSDFKEERNALQRDVFPKLRELCMQYGYRFQAIDLRWGVSEEAGLKNRTMRICLRELKRCQEGNLKPNFMILLGDRYGWRPLPEIIPVDIFKRLYEHLSPDMQELFEWRKDQPLDKKGWYRRDDNSIPPVYILRPRDGGAKFTENVEKLLLTALETAWERIRAFTDNPSFTIGMSATEQEILEGALKVTDAQQHVNAFFRKIEGLPQNPYPREFVDVLEDGTRDARALARLNDLKSRIKKKLDFEKERCSNVHVYTVLWHGDGINNKDLSEFVRDVYENLKQTVMRQIEKMIGRSEDEQEEETHRAFCREQSREFTGREGALKQIASFLRGNRSKLLVVAGPAGSGKSALMAEAVRRARALYGEKAVIARFIGASPESTNIIYFLRNLVAEIRRLFPAPSPISGGKSKEDEIPFELNPLIEAFHEAFKRPQGWIWPLYVFIDALDQFEPGDVASKLYWLPDSLYPHTRLIVSTSLPYAKYLSRREEEIKSEGTDKDEICNAILNALSRRRPGILNVRVNPLSYADGKILLTRWLAESERILQPAQRKALLTSFKKESNPLWLRVATNWSIGLASWDQAPEFTPTLSELIRQVIVRLSEEEHGSVIVERFLAYMACARHGLAEDEIIDILSSDALVMQDFRIRSPESPKSDSLPAVVWVRLYGDISLYLTLRNFQGATLLVFYHRRLLETVQNAFLVSAEKLRDAHRRLADYFAGCARGSDLAGEWESDSIRGFAECVFHYVKAGDYDKAEELVGNIAFLIKKIRLGLLESVLEDDDQFLAQATAEQVSRIEPWATFFKEKAHILRRANEEWPAYKILLQLATECPDDNPLHAGVEKWLNDRKCNWLWLHRIGRAQHQLKDSCLATLEGHTGSVMGVLVKSDGQLVSWAGGPMSKDYTIRLWDGKRGTCTGILKGHTAQVNGVLALADGSLLSYSDWSDKATIRKWDCDSGACTAAMNFENHSGGVSGARVLADGRILSWADDRTLRLWDEGSLERLAVLEGHTDSVLHAIQLSDGRLLSWSADRTLRLWKNSNGAPLAILRGHTFEIWGALELTGGRLLSWSADHTLRIWDRSGRACLAILEGHADGVLGCKELKNGRILSWSGSSDKTLRLWDIDSGSCLAIFPGHNDAIWGVRVLTDGRILSWSRDETIRLWDGDSGACLAILKGHRDAVRGARELKDGRILSWSNDHTIRIWDNQTLECVSTLEGHTDVIWGVLELSNGRFLSCSSDKTLRLWDSTITGNQMDLEKHADDVADVLVIEHRWLVSWAFYRDTALRLWDGKSGICHAVFEGHQEQVNGALALSFSRLLSWSGDHTLRVWNIEKGNCLLVLEGHSRGVRGALELKDGRLLSWAADTTLRIWDSRSGNCIAILVGHKGGIRGALELGNGMLISWSGGDRSMDHTYRIWDGRKGICLAVLAGHTDLVWAPVIMPDGRILSWSDDGTLRIWESSSGACTAILKGHKKQVNGAIILSDGRILSWSNDTTLRLWDACDGRCLSILKGHTETVWGALELNHAGILSWSGNDQTFRLWDKTEGKLLEVVSENEADRRHPDWCHARMTASSLYRNSVSGPFFGKANQMRFIDLYHKESHMVITRWETDAAVTVRCLLDDGSFVVTRQGSGCVDVLKLYWGDHRISFAEANKFLEELNTDTGAMVLTGLSI